MRSNLSVGLAVLLVACHRDPTGAPQVPVPVVPTTPLIPGMPQPGAANTPAIPGIPVIPGMPAFPGMPNIPGMPSIPGMPGAAPAAPVVNFRQLLSFAPDTLDSLAATAAADGETAGGMGFQVSEVHRNYGTGPKTLRLEITDTTANPTLRMAITIGQSVTVDANDRQAHGVTVAGNPGIFEWQRGGNGNSKVTLLVANRYIVHVEITGPAANDEAVTVAGQLNLAGLGAVH